MIIKGEASEIQINILRRSNSESEDYWDANWLDAEIIARIRGFHARYEAALRVDDFQNFYEKLILFFNENEIKEVEFLTLEEGLHLSFDRNHSSNIICLGKLKDEESNTLEFRFETDYPSLENFRDEIMRILKSYPLKGKN